MSKATTPKSDPRLDLFIKDLGNNPSLSRAFEKLYQAKKGDWPAMEKSLRRNKSFSATMIRKLAFTHELASWTGDNKTLISLFQNKKETGSMKDIALRLNKHDLKKLVKGAAIPKGVAKNDYVDRLYNKLYQQETSAVTIGLINDPKASLWNDEVGNMLSAVLAKMPEFNIKTTSIHELINNKAVWKSIPKEAIEEVIARLKTLQRITLISPVPEAIAALINANYTSAYSITQLPASQFVASIVGSELPYETLQYIYAEAEKKKAFYEHVLVTLKEAGEKTGIKIIDGDLPVRREDHHTNQIDPAVEEVLTKNYLSWNLLFGDADFCECGECTSVYSATAYYVELLQYLRNNNLEEGKTKPDPTDISGTPLEKLFSRRPDLGHLELTCENTNTILPYVDLVNEVMEQYIAFQLKPEDFNNYTGFNVAGETSGELLSAPQHTEQERAYQALQTSLFPFSLPYHQPIDATRILLNQLNSSRYEVIDTFRSNNADINFDIAADAEYLGLTEEEYSIVTGEFFNVAPDYHKTDEYYGLKGETDWLNRLSLVSEEFLPRTGVLYVDLVEVLKTQYLNPASGNNIRLVSPNNNCSLEEVKLLHFNNSLLTAGEYGKLHRFIRLWRKLGFTIDETDKAIMALGGGEITPELIHQLVAVKKIMARTGLELTKLLCFWGDISTAGENSLYQRLFLSHNLLAMDDVFKPVNGTFLATSGAVAQHLPVIMAALNLSADDVKAIKIHRSLPDQWPLTIENLSLLYRYRLLSKTLQLRIPAFIKLKEVMGNCFDDADTTLQFLLNLEKTEEAGFTPDQLSFVIKGVDKPVTPFIPTSKVTIALAKKITDGLEGIAVEHADLPAGDTASIERVRNEASLLYNAVEVEQIISVLEGTTQYNTVAPLLTDSPDFPVQLGKKVKYIKTVTSSIITCSLQVTGALTANELLQLKAVFPQTNVWSDTIDRISQQQDELFNDILAGIFATQPAEETIVKSENNAASPLLKRAAFLRVFLPYLRDKLKKTHIINVLSEQTGLDKAVLQSLLVNVLKREGFPLYDILSSATELPVPAATGPSWHGSLIPSSEDDFTFVVRSAPATPFKITLDNLVVIEHAGHQSNGVVALQSAAINLESDKVYQLSIEGVNLADLYWKTKIASVEPVPPKVLLPDFRMKATTAALEQLAKMAVLIKTLSLSADEVTYFHAHRADFNNIDLNDLSLEDLLRIIDYCRFRNSLRPSTGGILRFWEGLNNAETELSGHIASLTKWKTEAIEKLIAEPHFNLVKKDHFKNEINLLKLQQALVVASKIGMDIDKLFEWAIPTSDFDVCKSIAGSIQKSIRAQYNQTDWEQVIKPLNDRLRNNQKEALIAYLLQLPELKTAGVTDADGLFEYFLIDVQMDTCMETSRIKQAISSAQLFVQRCFLGLEEGIEPDFLDRDRWEWMQRYRIWEANRKVFLYPENWIESNLRDDKSPFFKELESELLQKDINKQNVTDALQSYLYKVDEVANMEVIGLYIEGEKLNDTKWQERSKLHVFSRTRNAPYFFYYRYLALDEMNWYPWEKVQVDIPGYDMENANGQITGNGCYLTPVVWNGRLMIFFPQFMKKTKPNPASGGSISDLSKVAQSSLKPIEFREIKMAYSEYKNGKWTPKQLSKDSLYDETHPMPDIGRYNFYPEELTDSIRITVYGTQGIGSFNFQGSNLRGSMNQLPDRGDPGTSFQYSFYMTTYQTHPENVNFYFNDDAFRSNFYYFPVSPKTDSSELYSFHFSNSEKLPGLNIPAELFEYNLSVSETETADSFGRSLPFGFHELKRPYSLYNWELFFHTPILMADALSKAQQFEEAMKWFHYVFNPMAEGDDDKRFWQFRPFKKIDSKHILEEIFNNLEGNVPDDAISEWRNNPFKPHLVARSRPVAYMKWVVMKYIDNILDWGDYLFRQDTIESINQATQLYVLAGHILGPKPMMIPKRGAVKTQTYLSLLAQWDAFGNAMSELELSAIYAIRPLPNAGTAVSGTKTADVFGAAGALYFCIPKNPKLLGYWDTLADRLFKIRHCQNIEGVVRKLPLFEPPIDPALLVKAASQGISISSVVNDLNAAMPNYRFYYLLQKALEVCNELKSLGSTMLSAIEKRDNETISLIRARHEGSMNNLMMEVKKLQLEEAQRSLDALVQNRKAPEARMKYYLQLIGDETEVPGPGSDFKELGNTIEKPVDESGLRLSKFEKEDMDKASEASAKQSESGKIETLAAILHIIPNFSTDGKPMGVGAGLVFGGNMLGNAMQAIAKYTQTKAGELSFLSANAAKKGGFQRALQERIFQANAAGFELKQIDKQITAQLIRISIANQEITNLQKQLDNANEVEEFLKNKYTNEELYTWMRGSLKTLYRQVYNLAYDLAKKAEKTYCFERGINNAGFIQSGYFDAGREGLLAGEQLYVGLKQLEAAYQENRGYDYEITKHISLRRLDPFALLQLKTGGSCEFDIPEVLFDMDYPGHFKRRIKSVTVSIPCIAGPYTGVNATIHLLNNRFRNSVLSLNYREKANEQDERFISYNIPITRIAASTAQNDAGMFELNFKDERYLPFEGAGVISRWKLELPAIRQFNYDTLSDVILHVRYIASEGGEQLKNSATGTVIDQLNQMGQQWNETGLHIPISLKHDMSAKWNLLRQGTIKIKIDDSWFPYFVKSLTPAIESVMFVAKVKDNPLTFSIDINGSSIDLLKMDGLNLCRSVLSTIALDTEFSLAIAPAQLEELEELVMVVKLSLA